MAAPPLVLLLEPENGQHHHGESLSREGFQVVSLPADEADVARIVDEDPAIVAAELVSARTMRTLEFAQRFSKSPQARAIPFILYGHHLKPEDIAKAAQAGALWVQVQPTDGARLAAAVRGILYSLAVRRAISRI